MIFLNIELAKAEIMAKDLPIYINGYHLDITGIFGNADESLIKLYQCPAKFGSIL
jgi:hypothetical protein